MSLMYFVTHKFKAVKGARRSYPAKRLSFADEFVNCSKSLVEKEMHFGACMDANLGCKSSKIRDCGLKLSSV